MVLIIDNYDSFTYNLVRYFEELAQSVTVITNDNDNMAVLREMQFDHLVISPGPGSPAQSGISIPAIEECKGVKPMLGVCLGHQAIAQSMGAIVKPAKHIRHGKTSTIQCDTQSVLFNECNSRFEATRYHSLIVDNDSLPSGFSMSAWCDDFGDREIMAIENREDRMYGVQFHPESLLSDFGHKILNNFLVHG